MPNVLRLCCIGMAFFFFWSDIGMACEHTKSENAGKRLGLLFAVKVVSQVHMTLERMGFGLDGIQSKSPLLNGLHSCANTFLPQGQLPM